MAAVSTPVSLVLSSVLAMMIFSLMQLYKPWFAANQLNTVLGGFLGSWLFVFKLTAISNLESLVLGDGFQARLFPEVGICLVGTVLASGTVHRVTATTSLLFSIVALYFINRVSQKEQLAAPQVDSYAGKKKRK